ncbi:MAG: DUF5686 family protein [Bacteroidota bacterium]
MRLTGITIFVLTLFLSVFARAQTSVSGTITEKGKSEPMPFVSVGFKGTTIGVTTDFEGHYTLKTSAAVDSIVISFVGYRTLTRKIKPNQAQTINIQLEEATNVMKEAVIVAGVNPALRIVNKAVARREFNNYNTLKSYECNSYNKTDVSMNNISEKMKNNTLLRPLRGLFDTTNQMKNEENKYILPIFISETQSKYYYNTNPSKTKEIIYANKIEGFGVEQGSYVVDMLGSTLLQFNFNDNWMRVLAKDFISPIASGCHGYYAYTLVDSVDIDGLKCYEIKLHLRRESDLGFLGTMWIADSTFAIRRIVAEISASANLNFIKRFKIQQEQLPVSTGSWLPVKTRAIIEIERLSANTSGFVAKMYRANSSIVVDQPKPDAFFDVTLEKVDGELNKPTTYWDSVRPEQLTSTEKQMSNMIDSVKKLPVVRTYTQVIQAITEGYYRAGKIDIGPYIFLVNYNRVEGIRTRIGFRTNPFFSKDWYYRGYIAYGFKDEEVKYGLGAERILSHRKWTTLGVHYKNDYDILGVTDPSSAPVFKTGSGGSSAFAAINMGSGLSRINKTIDYRAVFLSQFSRDWTFRLSAQNTYFEPLGRFYFAYLTGESPVKIRESFIYTAANIDIRFAYKEVLIARGINRFRMKLSNVPVATLSYTKGFKGVAGGHFNFNKVQLNLNQHVTTGFLGNADFSISSGKIFGKLPYPMLEVMRGNTSFIAGDNNFSLMNLYEFVADEYVHAWYVQHFEGLFFNRIPVVRDWRLRNYAVVKAAYGRLSASNRNIYPNTNPEGKPLSPFYEFKNEPYVEVGYGIENILRIMTVGVVHRLTYRNNIDVRKWGINVGFAFQF